MMIGRCAVVCWRRIVHARQVQVEQHQVDALAHRLEPFLAGARDAHREAGLLHLVADRLGDVGVVLDQQDAPTRVGLGRGRWCGLALGPVVSNRIGFHGFSATWSAWWRTSFASAMKITSSAMLVA
jgi:hypothetical protein